jgi:hypothetical protein
MTPSFLSPPIFQIFPSSDLARDVNSPTPPLLLLLYGLTLADIGLCHHGQHFY